MFFVAWWLGLILAGAWLYGTLYLKQKKQRLIAPMVQLYNHVDSLDLSWRLLWDQMNEGRRTGVVWDTVLFSLVETRLAGQLFRAKPSS
jgi:hypothetical protein